MTMDVCNSNRGALDQAFVGKKLTEEGVGLSRANIFVPERDGQSVSELLMDMVSAERESNMTFHFDGASSGNKSAVRDNGWFQRQADA
jgi:hypothetical protein